MRDVASTRGSGRRGGAALGVPGGRAPSQGAPSCWDALLFASWGVAASGWAERCIEQCGRWRGGWTSGAGWASVRRVLLCIRRPSIVAERAVALVRIALRLVGGCCLLVGRALPRAMRTLVRWLDIRRRVGVRRISRRTRLPSIAVERVVTSGRIALCFAGGCCLLVGMPQQRAMRRLARVLDRRRLAVRLHGHDVDRMLQSSTEHPRRRHCSAPRMHCFAPRQEHHAPFLLPDPTRRSRRRWHGVRYVDVCAAFGAVGVVRDLVSRRRHRPGDAHDGWPHWSPPKNQNVILFLMHFRPTPTHRGSLAELAKSLASYVSGSRSRYVARGGTLCKEKSCREC